MPCGTHETWRLLAELHRSEQPGGGAALGEAIGVSDSNRAVGAAVGRNPIAYLVPCHRVIRKSGLLGGYRWGERRKRAMLAWEAALVDGWRD